MDEIGRRGEDGQLDSVESAPTTTLIPGAALGLAVDPLRLETRPADI